MKPLVSLYKLGLMPYSSALGVQYSLFDRLKLCSELKSGLKKSGNNVCRSNSNDMTDNADVGNSLILLEHRPVYTIGIRTVGYDEGYFVRLKQTLADCKLEADFAKTSRGGLITFHGPGQLVAYPILDLRDFNRAIPKKSVRVYVKRLEETVINTLQCLGIHGAHTVSEYPGVWLDNGERKIAFIGISCKRFVTMHGISINCDCDLSWFDHIVSCGIKGKAITSIKKELSSLADIDGQKGAKNTMMTLSSVETVSRIFCQSFEQHFECKLVEDDNSIKLLGKI